MTEAVKIYPQRPSIDSPDTKADLERLSSPVEIELSQEQKLNVQKFEKQLTEGIFPQELVRPANIAEKLEKNIAEVTAITLISRRMCVDYFLTESGKELLQELIPDINNLPTDKNEVKKLLATSANKVELDQHKKMLTRSTAYAKKTLENQLSARLSGAEIDETEVEFFATINQPHQLVEKAKHTNELRKYYRSVEKSLALEPDSTEKHAKQAMLEIHKERINTLTATLYRHGFTLAGEIVNSSDEQLEKLFEELGTYLPALPKPETARKRPEHIARFVHRLDKFLQGVDPRDINSPITEDIQRLRENAEQINKLSNNTNDFVYSDVEQEVLKNTFVNAEQLKRMCEIVLAEYGLITGSEDDWTVEITDSADSLSVAGTLKKVKIPASYNRTLNQNQPAGALPAIDHEITHVIQHVNGERLGISLAEVGSTARSSLWFESGGVIWETVSQEELFGQKRTTNFTYLAALEKRLEGGTVLDCAESFYTELVKNNPDSDNQEMIKTAVDRTLRLFREGGEWTAKTKYWSNSGPLEYAEQKILADSIPQEQRWLFYIGRVNLSTIARLYSEGWFKKEDMLIPDKLPSAIVEEYVRTEILPK